MVLLSTLVDSSGEEQKIQYNSPAPTLRTPADSTASWLDVSTDDEHFINQNTVYAVVLYISFSKQAEDGCKNGCNFLDEAIIILYGEGDFSDPCHDKLRDEYNQWKRIPHLRYVA